MADMKVCDLDQQALILGGIRLQGWAEGDAATIEFDGPAFNYVVGADGEAVRSKNFNRSAVATFRLMPSSVVNDILSALHAADILTPNGSGVVPFVYEDLQGTTLLIGARSYIESPPNVSIGATATVREWKIRIHNLAGNWGSN